MKEKHGFTIVKCLGSLCPMTNRDQPMVQRKRFTHGDLNEVDEKCRQKKTAGRTGSFHFHMPCDYSTTTRLTEVPFTVEISTV